MQEAAGNGTYRELSVPDCFALYDDYFAPQGNAVILVQNQSAQSPGNGSLLLHVGIVPRSDNWAKNMWAIANGTGGFRAFGPPEPVTTWFLGPPRYQVARCLVETPSHENNRCRFEYSPIILATVCSLNLVKVGLLFYTCASHWNPRWWRAIRRSLRFTERPGSGGDDDDEDGKKHQPLSTLGDAIASFMRTPDGTTKGMCLASSDDFVPHGPLRDREPGYHALDHVGPRPFKLQHRSWMHAVSLWRRIFTLSL